MLRCIAIDDEELALELMEDNISKVPFLELKGLCNNPLQAIKIMQEQDIDLVFLDIQMPGLTGLQFIKSNLSRDCMYILVTAYEKYALEGYNLNVVDYLLKPVEFHRFVLACNKALELFELRKGKSEANESSDYIFVNVEYSLVKIQKTDILWIEGLKDYVKIFLKGVAAPVVTRMSLKNLEEQLSTGRFIRIHKSYLVAVAAISSIRKNSVFVSQTELPLGDSYRDAIARITGKHT